jgi:hypothetical protein
MREGLRTPKVGGGRDGDDGFAGRRVVMGYFWRCPVCGRLSTFDDDEDPWCSACEAELDRTTG